MTDIVRIVPTLLAFYAVMGVRKWSNKVVAMIKLLAAIKLVAARKVNAVGKVVVRFLTT